MLRKLSFSLLLTLIFTLICAPVGWAEWRVDFESKTVNQNQTGVTVDITVYWEINMTAFVLPVIVREIDPGAYWTGPLPVDTGGGPAQGVSWSWSNPGWADLIQHLHPESQGCAVVGDVGYDGISPDHFNIAAIGLFNSIPAQPGGWVVARLTFNVTGSPVILNLIRPVLPPLFHQFT